MQQNDKDKLLSREETAKLLSVSLVTLWDWTKKDIIPAYRIGYKVRYKKGEVLQALKKMNNFNKSLKPIAMTVAIGYNFLLL
ncbi:helix-turn-helix domain-containing protein [Flavobacterium sp.]|uniref:helix-turn-helix domain-containing protein n=1 Tax=Flavobacterium sp. TaxID=239 RepID=UPI003527155D